jgi:hypothetical protein
MAVVTISITESDRQLVSGVPTYLTLDTNVPATIFYTLDGTSPTTASSVYLGGELKLPTNQTTVIFNVFATDGVSSSAVIERTYRPVIDVIRQSHDQVSGLNSSDSVTNNRFPYGDVAPTLPGIYGNVGPNDAIVNKPNVPNVFDGFDGTATGTFSGGTDLPLENYKILFSERNAIGESGRGIGTLPAQVNIINQASPPQSANMSDKFFDPRAMVIYQDSRDEPFDPELVHINRQFFSLEDGAAARVKDGILYNTTAIEGMAPTGSLVRSQFNAKENTITYYFLDTQMLRWIISKEPAPARNPRVGAFNILFSSRSAGDSKVFRWHPFKGSRLI